jgi:hypothetical protein
MSKAEGWPGHLGPMLKEELWAPGMDVFSVPRLLLMGMEETGKLEV